MTTALINIRSVLKQGLSEHISDVYLGYAPDKHVLPLLVLSPMTSSISDMRRASESKQYTTLCIKCYGKRENGLLVVYTVLENAMSILHHRGIDDVICPKVIQGITTLGYDMNAPQIVGAMFIIMLTDQPLA